MADNLLKGGSSTHARRPARPCAHPLIVATSVIAVGTLASEAAAQSCFSWSGGFGPPPANGTDGVVYCMTVFDEDGFGPNPPSLFVGGHFAHAGGVAVNNLARWDGTAWHDVGGGVTGASGFVLCLSVCDDGSGPALFVGGGFTTAGATAAANIAKWNGATWSALGAGTNNFVWAIAEYNSGPGHTIYAGGDFTSAGITTLNFIAKWSGGTWSKLEASNAGTSGGVFALRVFGGNLYVGGAFPTAGITDPNTKFIARWNGTSWSSLGSGVSGSVFAIVPWDADGPGPGAAVLAVGGAFTTTGDSAVTLNRIGTWNGAAWSPLGRGMSAAVRALAVFDDECGHELYAGGDFFTAGAVVSPDIARWVGTSWKAVSTGMISTVRALARFADVNGTRDALYAGGEFSVLPGPVAGSHFVQWLGNDTDGDGLYDCWEAAGGGIDINCDGVIDLDLNALGATPDHKDVFVEVDAMTGLGPSDDVVGDVTIAFSMAPLPNPDGSTGIRLHMDKDEMSIAAPVAWTIDDTDGDGVLDWPTEFDAAKALFFGTVAQRTHPTNAANILAAKRLAYHYCIFAKQFDAGGSSGISEIGGNDFIVSLAGPGWFPAGGTENDQAGTFMHEFGHNLGLFHGGNQVDPSNDRRYNYKPNYHSVMNYTWQTPTTGYAGSWVLDYSRSAWPDLVETGIAEAAGMGGDVHKRVPVGPYLDTAPPVPVFIPAHLVREGGGVKLNSDADTADTFAYDINHLDAADPASPGDTLHGFNDWPALDYNFRDSRDFGDGAHSSANVLRELDVSARAMLNAMATLVPCPSDIVANDAVDVNDLLAVISTWGPCAAPCPGSPCAADVAPAGGDCVIDVNDLLAVISTWGPCP